MGPIRATVAVVGRGLFGRAAARHAINALRAVGGGSVVAVGPVGPDASTAGGVWSSHFDQGRVVRRVFADEATGPTWSALSALASRGFRELEQAGAPEPFLHRAGCLLVSSYPLDVDHAFCGADGRPASAATGTRVGLAAKRFCAAAMPQITLAAAESRELARKHGAHIPNAQRAVLEHGDLGAGYVDVPRLLSAQEAAFLRAGGSVVDATVATVRSLPRSRGGGFELLTTEGARVRAQHVVLCPGAFTRHHSLLPPGLPVPEIVLKTETVLLARLPDAVAMAARESMPALLWEVDTREFEGVYVVPPMVYDADGQWWIKLGCNMPHDTFLSCGGSTASEQRDLGRWTSGASGADEQLKTLKSVFCSLFPSLARHVCEFRTKRCVLTRTPTQLPYVDVHRASDGSRIVLATGGNGYGATTSDAVGRLAAQLAVSNELRDNASELGPLKAWR